MTLRIVALTTAVLLSGAAGCQPSTEPRAAAPATRRSLPAGDVIGVEGLYGSHAWLGIPYAEPPVGELRWRAPRPLARWQDEREALAFGSPCVQYASPVGGVPEEPGEIVGSEDCLFLNVWAPPFAPDAVPIGDERLPVMLWIHGGGNSIGESGFYNGGNLATT